MYLDYFGLDREPFTISPDPAFLYPSPQHRQALAHLKYGLDREGGFILLTGEVGTGKTTLTRLLLEQLPGNIRVAYILNTKLNSEDVLASICQDLDLDYEAGASIKTLTDLIYKDLLETHSQGKKTLLVLEEGQNLDPDVLETLRLLTNLETNTTKLLHILLVGQPELLELLARNDLRQLNQRVVSRFHIEPLNLPETTNYLVHRLKRAGGNRQIFDAASIKKLHKLSGGIPRLLNLLGERCLLGAYATSSNMVTPQIVQAAGDEVLGTLLSAGNSSAQKSSPKTAVFLQVAVVILIVGFGLYYFLYQKPSERPVPQSLAETPALTGSQETVVQPSEPEPEAKEINTVTEVSVPIEQPSIGPLSVSVAQENDAPIESANSVTNVPAPVKNTYEQLLGLWGLDADAANQKDFCLAARVNDLRCRVEESIDLRDLSEINRPGLVRLPGDQDNIFLYMLRSYSDGLVTLVNSSGTTSMLISDFVKVWDGGFVYIWRPPEGYVKPLYPGTRNSTVVRWTQQKLQAVFNDYEYIIDGGIYSQSVVRSVARFQSQQGLESDGLLGPRTILRFMDLTEELPRLDQGEFSSESDLGGF